MTNSGQTGGRHNSDKSSHQPVQPERSHRHTLFWGSAKSRSQPGRLPRCDLFRPQQGSAAGGTWLSPPGPQLLQLLTFVQLGCRRWPQSSPSDWQCSHLQCLDVERHTVYTWSFVQTEDQNTKGNASHQHVCQRTQCHWTNPHPQHCRLPCQQQQWVLALRNAGRRCSVQRQDLGNWGTP
eukprot:CAMPEP_0171073396 /NCGR_PEP_ID=MMETSP0766_2-20121228/11485_1 /TAXON_ID=439317 /ORGANISM="Gambierdiscus australes, Strain CAWD 149" /LENGTH=179 /DNA_ID=CAMNT_0011530083 /DNA_START=410 /DNA_END=945 /DNA_ORIENTATION=-